MKKMMVFCLTATVPRAETVDTAVLYCSANRADLEEIILSSWEEVEYAYFIDNLNFGFFKDEAIIEAKRAAKQFVSKFNITMAPMFVEE